MQVVGSWKGICTVGFVLTIFFLFTRLLLFTIAVYLYVSQHACPYLSNQLSQFLSFHSQKQSIVLRTLLVWVHNPCLFDAVAWTQHCLQGDVLLRGKSVAREGPGHSKEPFYMAISLLLPTHFFTVANGRLKPSLAGKGMERKIITKAV